MKFSLIAVAFTVVCTTSSIANACQSTVMGGCTQEPTHDTSSHMKSQIVNNQLSQQTSIKLLVPVPVQLNLVQKKQITII